MRKYFNPSLRKKNERTELLGAGASVDILLIHERRVSAFDLETKVVLVAAQLLGAVERLALIKGTRV